MFHGCARAECPDLCLDMLRAHRVKQESAVCNTAVWAIEHESLPEKDPGSLRDKSDFTQWRLAREDDVTVLRCPSSNPASVCGLLHEPNAREIDFAVLDVRRTDHPVGSRPADHRRRLIDTVDNCRTQLANWSLTPCRAHLAVPSARRRARPRHSDGDWSRPSENNLSQGLSAPQSSAGESSPKPPGGEKPPRDAHADPTIPNGQRPGRPAERAPDGQPPSNSVRTRSTPRSSSAARAESWRSSPCAAASFSSNTSSSRSSTSVPT